MALSTASRTFLCSWVSFYKIDRDVQRSTYNAPSGYIIILYVLSVNTTAQHHSIYSLSGWCYSTNTPLVLLVGVGGTGLSQYPSPSLAHSVRSLRSEMPWWELPVTSTASSWGTTMALETGD